MNGNFQKVGVVGAGVMGARLAALMAGAGVRVELLDVVDEERGQVALDAVANLKRVRPQALFVASDIERIRPGDIKADISRLASCDWIIETVTERLSVKRKVLAMLDEHGFAAPIGSNTSGISLAQLKEGRSDAFKRKFVITHFFNPPRHMKLVEMVAGDDADANAVASISEFLEGRLGKGIILAKDTPNFIANRIGIFHALDVMHLTAERGWPIEAVDTVLGPAVGRPKSALFRTADMVGLDTVAYVAGNAVKGCPEDEWVARMRIPQFLQQMIVKGWTGSKAGRGFYYNDAEAGKIMAIDPATLDYRPRVSFSTPSLLGALNVADPADRLRRVVFAKDQAGEIAWPAVSRAITYAARRLPEIAGDIQSVDRAMRWGYRWELGPFEIWDALGIRNVAERLEAAGCEVPEIVLRMIKEGHEGFYERGGKGGLFLDPPNFTKLKGVGRLVEAGKSASIVDVGDGVLACEFTSKMNTIDEDTVRVLHRSIEIAEREGAGLIIANDGEAFSVGANLKLVLGAAVNGRFDELDRMVREFQALTQRIRYSRRPVVAAPFGMTLGGGCELALACARRVASIETYMGFVEMGAGLIPAGGGCKNLLLRTCEPANLRLSSRARSKAESRDLSFAPPGPQPKVTKAFELIATARVSTSAKEASGFGLLSSTDRIVMDRETLLGEAKRSLLELAQRYSPPDPNREIELPGRGGELVLTEAAKGMMLKGKATEYDLHIAKKLAHVLAGGDRPTIHKTTEDHILDLEREAFLSLIGETETQKRIKRLVKSE